MPTQLSSILLYKKTKMIDKILLLGDPKLYEVSAPVKQSEILSLQPDVKTLHDLIHAIRDRYGFGRGIAAPQIGLMKRLVCLDLDKPYTLYNPVLSDLSDEMFELWDDCMSFPNLHVSVARHRYCTLTFRDENWNEQRWHLEDKLSELLQHEVDHLDGILATMRAIDDKAFKVV